MPKRCNCSVAFLRSVSGLVSPSWFKMLEKPWSSAGKLCPNLTAAIRTSVMSDLSDFITPQLKHRFAPRELCSLSLTTTSVSTGKLAFRKYILTAKFPCAEIPQTYCERARKENAALRCIRLAKLWSPQWSADTLLGSQSRYQANTPERCPTPFCNR